MAPFSADEIENDYTYEDCGTISLKSSAEKREETIDYREFVFVDVRVQGFEIVDSSAVILSDGRALLTFGFKSLSTKNNFPHHRVTKPLHYKLLLATRRGAIVATLDFGQYRWDCTTSETLSFSGSFDSALFPLIQDASVSLGGSYSAIRC